MHVEEFEPFEGKELLAISRRTGSGIKQTMRPTIVALQNA